MPSAKPDCPEYVYPLVEPAYSNKVRRELTTFEAGLAGFSPRRAAALDELLTTATILDIQAMLSARDLTSAELVVYYVDRIRRFDVDRLNAVMRLNPAALAIATALDAERSAGAARGPLHGIPVLIKDNIATGDGMPTTAGAYALRNWKPVRDAFLVRRLREAGAIILGKANLSEFANFTDPCTPNGFSTLGGQTRNPHGPFDASGSSSGSAVAVAANLVAVAIGTETQGSVIMPAKGNGIFGLKTSRGSVSRDAIVPLLEAQDVPGPLARTATDLALVMSVIAGVDPNDPATAASAALEGVDFLAAASMTAAKKVRVGVPTYLPESADAQAARAQSLGNAGSTFDRDKFLEAIPSLNAAVADPVAAMLEKAGLTVVPVEAVAAGSMAQPDLMQVLPAGFRRDFDRFMVALGSEAPVASLAEVVRINAEDPANRVPYGQRSLVRAVEATMTDAELEAAVAANRQSTGKALDDLLERYGIDVLYMPRGQHYAAAGYPAVSVPNGLDDDGQPQAMIFTGGFLSEPSLIAVAYALEQTNGGRPLPNLNNLAVQDNHETT